MYSLARLFQPSCGSDDLHGFVGAKALSKNLWNIACECREVRFAETPQGVSQNWSKHVYTPDSTLHFVNLLVGNLN